MTVEAFKKVRFTGGMKAIYQGAEYDIGSADFEDFTIGLVIRGGLLTDVPCEDCEIVVNSE